MSSEKQEIDSSVAAVCVVLEQKPFHVCLLAEGSAEALGEELAEFKDTGLQLVGADRGPTATGGPTARGPTAAGGPTAGG